MDGFYITVKNGLLEPKHIKAMHGDKNSGAIWLFLWLLDKMTIIDGEKGEGKVLGGKPVKFEDVEKTIKMSRRTYQTWLNILREGNYITTAQTPYGLSITVHKAYKVFGQKTDVKTNAHLAQEGMHNPAHLSQARPFTSNIRQDSKDNKDINILDEQRVRPLSPKVEIKRERSDKQKVYDRICEHLEKALDMKITTWGKQLAAIKDILDAGYTELQITKTIDYMAHKDDFYSDKGFDMTTVAKQIPLYKAQMRKQV